MAIPVIVLFAPTASGKTALAINLFGKDSLFFASRAELISADSMQVYKGLDIGTAKPDSYERSQLPHHLIDVLNFDQQFNVSDFIEKADVLCEEIYSRGKIPLVAGGTGFYIRNFLTGLPETPESDESLRNKLKERSKAEGLPSMFRELETIDPLSALKINPNDEYRILRALEVFYLTGKPRSAFEVSVKLREKFDFITIIIRREREELYQRINSRVDQMFALGLENEVRNLMKLGAKAEMPGMQAIGYREWFSGDMTTPEGIEKIRTEIKHASRKYAKKQYTYIKEIPGSITVDFKDDKQTSAEIAEILKNKVNF